MSIKEHCGLPEGGVCPYSDDQFGSCQQCGWYDNKWDYAVVADGTIRMLFDSLAETKKYIEENVPCYFLNCEIYKVIKMATCRTKIVWEDK